MATIINTREDLDAVAGTPEHDEFMSYLKGSMTRKVNMAIYPDGYGKVDYVGPEVAPVWSEIEDLTTITNFGFTKADFA